MKYPQLVSPRAVNAISDWLVSRLEQLGVESPQIYTRLLLSLLQSSVQVNDPIEFSNLEAFFANRKGGHKRFHLPSDTETLKKLNAVQCLREIVSNEQETATIEQLVDELCEKLKDIEKQTQNLSDEERFLIETHLNTDSLLQTQTNTQLQHQQHPNTSSNTHTRHNHNHNHHQQQQQQQHHQHHHHHPQQITQIYNNSHGTALNSDSKRHHHVVATTTATASTDALNDLDNDPKKRYFRAFPALSKEMEDSFRIWRRNAKSLAWPVVGRSIVADSNNSSASLSSSSASSIISSSNFGANSSGVTADKSVDKKLKGVEEVGGHYQQLESKVSAGSAVDIAGSGCSSNNNNNNNIGGSDVQQQQQQHQGAVAAAASVKKKSKRRRNQALCKGKTIQNIRKLSVGTTTNSVGGNKYHHYAHHRNSSPAWDTDFKGCWEMGPDLIKEFLSRQNGAHNKRNRSSSDSMDHEDHNIEHNILNEIPAKADDKTIMKGYIDLSFCCDDDDDDHDHDHDHDDETQHQHYTEEGVDYVDEDYDDNTLASVSELTMDSLNPNPRRLYQREGHVQKSLTFSNIEGENTLDETSDSVDPLDFQQFKAKFNSSVEALWKNAQPTPTISTQQTVGNQQTAAPGGGISSAFYATTSLNALAPFKRDLWNFWSNYNQQNFDQLNNKLSTTASTSSMITTTRLDDSSASSGAGADIANSSDYFSMPSNLDDFDKSVGGVRRTNEAGASLGAHTPSINVFLQNSIWSTSRDGVDAVGTTSVVDTDDNFLFKVWDSNKKLSQLDVGNAANGEKMPTLVADNDGGLGNNDFNKSNESSTSLTMNNSNLGANLQFPPFQSLKWSEGINAGPPYTNLLAHAHATQHEMESLNNTSSLRADANLASFSSAANISGATWEAPAYGQNAQPDLKSWCASNPMSLTEMYGNDVCDSIVNQTPVDEHESEVAMGPAVTLPNHCANTSGFVAYSRIKQCGIVQPQTKPLQSSSATRLPKDFFRSGEEENLLNSERTHFHPIEHFVDGHTFDISNALDTVDFERTKSGLMRYDSEEYLEYTRNDIYMADEEVATNATNLLKYGRRPIEDNDDKFVIKFRVKRSGEMACQTEEHDFELAAAKMAEVPSSAALIDPPLEVTNMFHNTFSLSRQANNEAIMAAVTKAVAAAAKAAAENHLNAGHFCWLPTGNINTVTTATSTNSGLENNPLWLPENNPICDEVDYCKIDTGIRGQQQQPQLAQNWSMQEVEKQCHQRRCLPQQQQPEIKRKFPSTVDMERSEDNSLDNSSLHTLWGMCAVCNSCEYGKSMPANRLLRDELQLEADEIMSDLRYMQDLYIGESDIITETTADTEQGTVEDKLYANANKEMNMNPMKNPWNMDVIESAGQLQDPAQVNQLMEKVQKVNQLIEDLLKPENTAKLPKESVEYDKLIKESEFANTWNLQADQSNTKNLWQFSEEEDNNIWQHKPLIEKFEGKSKETDETFNKPMKLLKQVDGSLSEEPQYMETLNWKHDHLAKIWQQTIPTSSQIEETFLKNKQNEMANNIINENLLKEQEQEQEQEPMEGSQKLVEEKNLKNLQNISALTPPSTGSCNTYKRVQQFLNNSAAKLKLAANRKRRHSASQNFYQQQHLQYGSSSSNNNNSNSINNNNNNNNNDNITDLNAYKQTLNETLKAAKEQQQQQQEVTPYNSATITSHVNLEEQPPKQTIITCKYWTTATNGTQSSLDSAAAAMMLLAAATNANATANTYDQEDVMLEENIFGNTFSCLIDKNASILKHVTMMTRPLTR